MLRDGLPLCGDEFIAVVGPVTWVGIVEAKVDDGFVWGKGEGIVPSLLLDVGAVSMVE